MEDMRFFFKGIVYKWIIIFLCVFYWLEGNYMVTFSRKGGWET